MSERVTMPALGESVTEGTVSRWLKQVGDTVALDEPLLEVSTDKGRHRDPLAGCRHPSGDPGGRGRDSAGRHRPGRCR